MKDSHSATRKFKSSLALSIFAATTLLSPAGPALGAGSQSAPMVREAAVETASRLPAEFGQVLYEQPGKSDKHLYIICQSHRSATSGNNGGNTATVQAEIYRIGEWLIQNQEVELLLPEGYFGGAEERGDSSPYKPVAFRAEASSRSQGESLDDQTLQSRLSDTKAFTNADKLLHESYRVNLRQVEDKTLYFKILETLFQAEKNGGLLKKDLLLLDYLQERRSAAMLQMIPSVVNGEYRKGGIVAPKAIWTIGMAHVDEIIRFLKAGEIEISQPHEMVVDQLGAPHLLQQDFNITVIVPRSLLEDKEAMRLAKIDL